MNNFKLIMTHIETHGLLDQIAQHPELWNTDDSWTRGKQGGAIYNTDNIVLRYNRSSDPRAPAFDWDKPAFSILHEAQKIIFDLMRALPGEHLAKVIITKLRPGEHIAPHIDMLPPGMAPYFQRYQIPLSVSQGVAFWCGEEELYMRPGNAYWFNNQLLHSVINNSDEDRISMLTDIRPFIPLTVP